MMLSPYTSSLSYSEIFPAGWFGLVSAYSTNEPKAAGTVAVYPHRQPFSLPEPLMFPISSLPGDSTALPTGGPMS